MTDKKIVERVINHPNFKKNYNVIDHIYFNVKKNVVLLTATTNEKYNDDTINLSPIMENIILSYRMTGCLPPKIHNIILDIYNKRGKKLSTVTMSCS
jgi:hypothetical protein